MTAPVVVDSGAASPAHASLRLETPEGIDLELRPAGPVVRGLALVVDETIAGIATAGIAGVLAFLGQAGAGLALVVWFFVEWFYPVLFEVLRGGQTPGKRMMSLRVVNADATPIGWNASLLRNLLRVADLFPVAYLTGLVSLCLTRRFQRLGDLAADTLVVHATRERPAEGALDETIAALGARPAPVALSSEEQRALLGYAERHGGLSEARAIELADVLEPILGVRGPEARRETLRIANGISGDA